jgi:cytochrome c oxidase cbb3-type subunit 3
VQTPPANNEINQVTTSTSPLLAVPLGKNIPGAVSTGVKIENPMANDPNSVQRGMKYFAAFNCVGCHMANGGGGMGPALSNSFFKFGDDPGNIYLVISHGAPLGMPAWGTIIPEDAIWDLVSYVQSISKAPNTTWGTTVSAANHMPAIEQVPAEFEESATPWDHVEPFSNGQKPR